MLLVTFVLLVINKLLDNNNIMYNVHCGNKNVFYSKLY